MHQFSSGASALHSEMWKFYKRPCVYFHPALRSSNVFHLLGRRSLEIGNDAKSEMKCFQLQRQDEHVNYV